MLPEEEAYIFARKNGPSDETRKISCESPEWAYLYAKYVDKCFRNDTRSVTLKNPKLSYLYALWVDESPREDTRKAVCQNSEIAYRYANYVDKGFHEDTWKAVQGSGWEALYFKKIGKPLLLDCSLSRFSLV